MRIETRFKTSRSPAQAFKFIATDFFDNHQKWDPDLLQNIKLTEGPVGLGTKGRSVTRFAGKQKADFKVTGFEPDKLFEFVNTTGMVNLLRRYTFKPAGKGADITFVFDMTPKYFFMKPIFPIIAAQTKKRVQPNIDKLKALLDSAQ